MAVFGPAAGLSAMEGKALPFKCRGGVHAAPICLGTGKCGEIGRRSSQWVPRRGDRKP